MVEIVELSTISKQLPRKHEFGQFAATGWWARTGAEDPIKVTVKDARVAAVGPEEN